MSPILACPNCERDLYRPRVWPLIPGETILSASLFEPLEGVPQLVDGTPALCPFCGAALLRPNLAAGHDLLMVVRPVDSVGEREAE